MKNPENTKYGRCEATNRNGEQCGRAAIGEHGKCGYHGGKAGRPMEHGIFSDVVREEDQAVLDALEDIQTAQKLEETLNLQIMKLRRAVELTDNSDAETDFWAMFERLVEGVDAHGEIDPKLVRELSKLLQAPGRSQRDLMDLIRKTAKDLHKIRDGETVNVEHGADAEDLEDLKEMADSLF